MSIRDWAWVLSLLLISFSTLGNITPADIDEYLPVAQALNAGRTADGLAACRKLAGHNEIACVAWYYIYSRGELAQSVNYAKAGEFIQSHADSGFWAAEESSVWHALRLPPVGNEENAAFFYKGRLLTYPLNGKYELKKCYLEANENFGGVAARALFRVAKTLNGAPRSAALTQAVMQGSAEAFLELHKGTASYVVVPSGTEAFLEAYNAMAFYSFSAADLPTLCRFADAGHLHSMIEAARVLQMGENDISVDLAASKKYLQMVIAACRQFQAAGCPHAAELQKNAEKMLAVIPDAGLATADLLTRRKASKNELEKLVLTKEIIRRNDHPGSLYLQAKALINDEYSDENNEKAEAMIRTAAEQGFVDAINEMKIKDFQNRWYWNFLYGKFKCGTTEADNLRAFKIALSGLNRHDDPEVYKANLKMLAEYYPEAQKRYIERYGTIEDKSSYITYKARIPELAKLQWVNKDGEQLLFVQITPGDQQNYIELYFNGLPDKPFAIEFLADKNSPNIYPRALMPPGHNSGWPIANSGLYADSTPLKVRVLLFKNLTPQEFYIRFRI